MRSVGTQVVGLVVVRGLCRVVRGMAGACGMVRGAWGGCGVVLGVVCI